MALLLLAGCRAQTVRTADSSATAVDLSHPKTFGGRVLEVGPRSEWFVMEGGASRRHPRPGVVTDRKTRWAGLRRKGERLRVGDTVRAATMPQPDGSFRATQVHVQDPAEQPGAAGVSAPH